MKQTRQDTARRSGHQTATSPSDTRNDAQFELSSVIAKSKSRDEMYGSLVAWLQKSVNCAGAGAYHQDGDSFVAGPNNFTGPIFENAEFPIEAAKSAQTTITRGRIHESDVGRVRNLRLISVPVPVSVREFESLTAALVVTETGLADTSALVMAASYAALWFSHQQHATTRNQLELTAAAMGMLTAIQSAESFRASCITLVNALKQHLNCQTVVLGLVRKTAAGCAISAVSGMADLTSDAALSQSMTDALDECLDRNRLSVFPADDASNRDSLLSHQKLASDLQADQIVSHPLLDSTGEIFGAWLVVDSIANIQNNDAATLLRSAATPVADALRVSQQADKAFFANRKRQKSIWQWAIRIACVAVAAMAIMLIPVSYVVHCECAAEPDVKRFVVAPHEGLVERTFAEPGDVVKAGQLLARMDGRDVRWELAGLVAKQEQAKKDYDSGLLGADIGKSQRAGLELKQLEARKNILTRRKEGLTLTSPIDGIVLDGHMDRVENAPVTIGQPLYEVAPLNPVTVEVAIPGDEHSNVETNFKVTVRFDGVDSEFTGTINRIHPRSEVRDGHNVFIAEVVIDNDDAQLRPGMSGYARIHGRVRSLGWSLFHRPWEHFCKSLPF